MPYRSNKKRWTGAPCALQYTRAANGLDYDKASCAIGTRKMAGIPHPQQNHILDALPQPERERLFPYLTLVALPLGKALYEEGDTLRRICFPTDVIISLLYVLKD